MSKIRIFKFRFFFLKNEPSFFYNSMLLATHASKSSAISFKNRFLSQKTRISTKLLNFFNFKGDLRTQHIILFRFYLLFCRTVYNAAQPHTGGTLHKLILNSPDFVRLFFSNLFLSSFDHAYMFRCSDLIPNVKVVLVSRKQKKTKKNKKLKKYSAEYRLIKPAVRLQTLNRWLASLLRVEAKTFSLSIYKLLPPVLLQPKTSKLYQLRQKIYGGMSLH